MMTEHERAVEAAGEAAYREWGDNEGMPNWTTVGAMAVQAYLAAMSPRVLVTVPGEKDHMDAPGQMDAGMAIGWADGYNAALRDIRASAERGEG